MTRPDPDFAELLGDLAAEHAALDRIVADQPPEAWDAPTPAAGWLVRDQIGHLHHYDRQAVLAATDPAAFVAGRDAVFADPGGYEERTLAFARRVGPDELLAGWRDGRVELLAAFGELGGRERLEWYGPPMSAMSAATARLMETWAHGQDVVDALDALDPSSAGDRRPPTDRLRHVAHLGVRTRRFSYAVRGLEPPAAEVRVELDAPSGARWTWGPEGVADRIAGPAVDFCLLVTQRRHRDDLDLEVTGPAAESWVEVAQAFAGPVGPGREPIG